jgi:hypothetical protein
MADDDVIPFEKPHKNGPDYSTRFKKGGPGGPGRPKGSRSKAAVLAEQIATDQLVDVVERVLRAATIEGDTMAAKLILDRLWPTRRGRPVAFAIPATRCQRHRRGPQRGHCGRWAG